MQIFLTSFMKGTMMMGTRMPNTNIPFYGPKFYMDNGDPENFIVLRLERLNSYNGIDRSDPFHFRYIAS